MGAQAPPRARSLNRLLPPPSPSVPLQQPHQRRRQQERETSNSAAAADAAAVQTPHEQRTLAFVYRSRGKRAVENAMPMGFEQQQEETLAFEPSSFE